MGRTRLRLLLLFLAAESNAYERCTFRVNLLEVQLGFMTVIHIIWMVIMLMDQVPFLADEFYENSFFFFLMFS